MFVECSKCKAKLRVTDENIRPDGSSIKCHECSSIIFFSKTSTPIETREDYEDTLNRKPFFQKISAYFQSPRKVSYRKINNTLQIKFFLKRDEYMKITVFLTIGLILFYLIWGFSNFLPELINIKEIEDIYTRGVLFLILLFYMFIPLLFYSVYIHPLLKIRTIVLDSNRLTVLDSFFGKKAKIKIRLFKQDIKSIGLREPYFFEKITNEQPRKRLFLIHKGGKFELISSAYPLNDLGRIQELSEKYLSGETIEDI